MIVYEFIYNSDTMSGGSITISIHKSRKGAEMAMEFHKDEVKKEHEEFERFPFDEYQSWNIRETKLKD